MHQFRILQRRQVVLAAALALSLVQCGSNKSKSMGAEFEVLPSQPIVITADTEIGGKTVKGPYFRFQLAMNNTTDEPITVVAIEIEVNGVDQNGLPKKTKVSFDAGTFSFKTLGLECNYSNFGTWAPNENKAFALDNGNTSCAASPVFYVGGNPRGPSDASFTYRVRVKPVGWFGNQTEATDRFERTFTFRTK